MHMAARSKKDQSTEIQVKESDKGKDEMGEDLLTVHEVASHLRVDDTTVRRWIKSGALEAIALPHRGKRRGYRVRKLTLDELFNRSSLPV
jgi:excisionase family DNA binding protein